MAKLENLTNRAFLQALIDAQPSYRSKPIDAEAIIAAMNQRVKGQTRVTEEVARFIQQQWANEKLKLKRPIANFLFAGSGASGSELADTIAEYLFPERKALLRFAGSELTDAEAQDRLVGPRLTCCFGKHTEHAPQPVTHLTHRVLCDPKRVIVFDDIERACPEVVRLILLMMTEGSLTEPSYGKVAEFNHSIVILTSGLECSDLYKLHPGLEGSIDRVFVFESLARASHEPEVRDDGRI